MPKAYPFKRMKTQIIIDNHIFNGFRYEDSDMMQLDNIDNNGTLTSILSSSSNLEAIKFFKFTFNGKMRNVDISKERS